MFTIVMPLPLHYRMCRGTLSYLTLPHPPNLQSQSTAHADFPTPARGNDGRVVACFCLSSIFVTATPHLPHSRVRPPTCSLRILLINSIPENFCWIWSSGCTAGTLPLFIPHLTVIVTSTTPCHLRFARGRERCGWPPTILLWST